MEQTWRDLLFAHWPVLPATLRPHVPPTLHLESFEGTAWLAITPFRMTGVRARGMPALPGLSEFPEINVRTYVSFGGKPGVYFFSLDAANLLAVQAARLAFHLPYFHAEMSAEPFGNGVSYRTRRRETPPAEFEAHYEPEEKMFRALPGTREHFLAERYCLYAVDEGRVFRAEIHHEPWQLQPARAEIRHNTMGAAIGFFPAEPPVLHFSRRLKVRIWLPERLRLSDSRTPDERASP